MTESGLRSVASQICLCSQHGPVRESQAHLQQGRAAVARQLAVSHHVTGQAVAGIAIRCDGLAPLQVVGGLGLGLVRRQNDQQGGCQDQRGSCNH